MFIAKVEGSLQILLSVYCNKYSAINWNTIFKVIKAKREVTALTSLH